ncbi:MAG TPA: glucose 1-dehydrogenase [Verrucomicrobiales bacterium]|nr:glucose 1-dehydrogenase [Verrucomicrobiales bacterium]
MDPFRLDGEIALVTGAGTGIGLGIARAMSAAGARIILTGRRREPLETAAHELGNNSLAIPHDLLDFEAAPALRDHIVRQCGAPSILVNNAGIHLKKDALEVTEEEFLQVLNTHVTAAAALSRAFAAPMIQAGRGSILFISSMTALIGMPKVVAYSAAKAAVRGLVLALTADLAPRGLRVNAIAPGWIDTPMLHRALEGDPERRQRILSRTPLGRFGDPSDVGRAAVYLSSPAAKFVTGVCLPIDGGGSIGF